MNCCVGITKIRSGVSCRAPEKARATMIEWRREIIKIRDTLSDETSPGSPQPELLL